MGLLPFEKVKRQILVKKETKTDDKFGFYPDKRPIEMLLRSGLIPLDKPKGPSSHQVSSYVQKALCLSKAGHAGTLDPGVTGVLCIGIGDGTKIVQNLLTAGKEYVCLMHLHKDADDKKIREVMSQFLGRIKQLPPLKCAVKRQTRYRKIYYIDILEIDGKDVLFRVGCQAGTYIRKLCADIGIKLKNDEGKSIGAHMQELRRTKTGAIGELDQFGDMFIVTLQDVHDAYSYYKNEGIETYLRKVIYPIELGVEHLAKIYINDSCVDSICHGASLKVPGIAKLDSEIQVDEDVAVMTLKKELVCTGKSLMTSRQIMENKQGVVVKPSRVYLETGIYPRITE